MCNSHSSCGLDVCASIEFVGQECGSNLAYYISSLQGYIPWVIFNGTYDLSNICAQGHGSLRGPAPLLPIHGAAAGNGTANVMMTRTVPEAANATTN